MTERTITTAEKVEQIALANDRLGELAVEAATLRSQITQIERGLVDEPQQDHRELVVLYAEMGRVLPDVVEKTFEQVEAFHRSVTENRRVHLADDLAGLRGSLAAMLAEVERTEAGRDRLLGKVDDDQGAVAPES
ncbi:ABC-three component system protein [Rhizobium leguminosarum]|uniref:ABC-three component system protein n=1 Tax=Rhizobium leguminosarum TaxID=384 RepID=UPI002E10C8BC|nr:hypothetical protein U8Q02_40815 [Rhizobium leguminosarum]